MNIKLIVIIIIYILILLYFFIYQKYSFKNIKLYNIIIINLFEIFIFRIIFIIICNIVFSIENNIALLICSFLSLVIIILIINNFLINHLYYFSLHFVVYPFDYYSSFIDIFHLIEKILISITLQNSNKFLNEFLFVIVFLLQLICFLFSVYVFYYKSYYIMNNIFLNKSKFSFIFSNLISSFIMIILKKKNLRDFSFVIFVIIIYIMIFIIIQIFYNPYRFVYFNNDDNVENLYFYFFIIDHQKNDTFLLEEKLEQHYSACKNCELCYNLKTYLNKRINYKKLYKILYKDSGVLSKLINELIHDLQIHTKESFKNNSYYLINFIYCYYIYNNKKDYVMSSNLKTLYELINEENKNILENHLLSTEQIILINNFLNKAEKILNNMKEIVIENIIQIKVEKFFSLFRSIFELKDKKFKTKLYYNKNEGIINFFRYISICSMIYEEIFNISLSSGGITLKDNQIFLDDLSNKNKSELNQIIIQLDLLNFENKIIYIVGEFAKYKDKALCQLFPNIFRNKQLLLIKKKIINSNHFQNLDKGKRDIFGNNSTTPDGNIDLQCVIYDKEDQNKYKLIYLRLNLIYPIEITKQILLSGIYYVENNIIITLDKSSKDRNKEIILNYEEKESISENKYIPLETNKTLIKIKKNEKYYKNQKLIFINKYFINPNCYNIYSILNPIRQKTYKNEINTQTRISMKNPLFEITSKMQNDIYGESEGNNFNYLLQSTSASTFSKISNDKHNYKKRNKAGNKNNKKKRSFKYFQIGLLIFAIIIILCQFICHITIINNNNYNENQNMALMFFRNYYGLFNTLVISILSSVCLVNVSNGDYCSSTFDIFQDYYNIATNTNNLKLNKYIFSLNTALSKQISQIKQQLTQVLSNYEDPDLFSLINGEIPSFYINQNITKNKVILQLKMKNETFLSMLDYITTGFLIMSSKPEYLSHKVYIVNNVNLYNLKNLKNYSFIHIKLTEQLSQYQSYYYYLILNYQNFMQRLDTISLRLTIKTSILGSKSIKIIFISIVLNFIFYLLVHVVLFLYIFKYYKLIIDLCEEIDNKMNLKNDNIGVKEMFLQKIEKLKIIVSLYKQDIYQAIIDLNFIYDNYKKFIEEKNKEIEKYLKKEKYTTKNVKSIRRKNIIKFKHIINIPENKRHFIYLFLTLIYSILLNIIILIIWISYNIVNRKVNVLISTHGYLSNDSYKLMSYYQLMIFQNFTIEDINNFERYNQSTGKDLFSNMYTDIQALYDSKKVADNLRQYNLGNIDHYYNYTCKTYYEYLFSTNAFLTRLDVKYKDFLIFVCESSNIFKSNNYKTIFSILFEYIQIGINEIKDRSYKGLIDIRHNGHFPKIIIYSLTVYNFAFEILGGELQKKSYQKINSMRMNYISISFTIYYITSFVFILIIIFGYILKINTNYNRIHELKKVFKVCNKKE